MIVRGEVNRPLIDPALVSAATLAVLLLSFSMVPICTVHADPGGRQDQINEPEQIISVASPTVFSSEPGRSRENAGVMVLTERTILSVDDLQGSG